MNEPDEAVSSTTDRGRLGKMTERDAIALSMILGQTAVIADAELAANRLSPVSVSYPEPGDAGAAERVNVTLPALAARCGAAHVALVDRHMTALFEGEVRSRLAAGFADAARELDSAWGVAHSAFAPLPD